MDANQTFSLDQKEDRIMRNLNYSTIQLGISVARIRLNTI